MAKNERIRSLEEDQLISLSALLSDEQGDYKNALLLLEVALMKDPQSWIAHNNRGTVLDLMGMQSASLFSYKKAIELNPDCHSAYYNIGRILQDRGQYPEALFYYQKSADVLTNKASAYSRMATCYISLEKPKEALEYSKKAAEHQKDSIVLANLAMSLSMNERYEEALQLCEEFKPSEHYSNVRSFILYKTEKYLEALSEIDSTLNTGALDYDLAIRKFYCLSGLDRIQEAIQWIEFIEKNYPFHAHDYNNLGYELMTRFRLNDIANALFRKAVQEDPSLMAAWNNLQASLGEQGKLEECLQVCDESLVISPFDKKTLGNKYTVLKRLGKTAEAIGFVMQKGAELFGN